MRGEEFSKLSWLKRTDGHKFTGAEFRVLVAIFNHSDAEGKKAHPGLKRLSEETGYRKSGISEAITSLKARGWIRETHKGSGFTGNASVFELVPDAPNPPNSSATAEQPRSSSSATAEPVVPLDRNNPPEVVPLQRNPSDPGLSDPGSDPFGSDQYEVRYSPNHVEDQDETGPGSRSLADAGPEHDQRSCDGRGQDGPSLREAASAPAAEQPADRQAVPATAPQGVVSLRPPAAVSPEYEDPFASEPAWLTEARAREVRREPATAAGPLPSPWED